MGEVVGYAVAMGRVKWRNAKKVPARSAGAAFAKGFEMIKLIRVFHRESPVSVLGPYRRACIWVQGCSLGCKNCIVPESWNSKGGEIISLDNLVEWILQQKDIEGITLSGGEPMEQAGALAQLIKLLRQYTDIGVMCFTGYTLEHLQAHGSDEQKQLLNYIDLLIDGHYNEQQHADLLWRGSNNQRLLLLTERYRNYLEERFKNGDSSAGLEFYLHEDSSLQFVGVPHVPGFRKEWEKKLSEHGVHIVKECNG